MKVFELNPKSLGKFFGNLTHLTCNSPSPQYLPYFLFCFFASVLIYYGLHDTIKTHIAFGFPTVFNTANAHRFKHRAEGRA